MEAVGALIALAILVGNVALIGLAAVGMVVEARQLRARLALGRPPVVPQARVVRVTTHTAS